MHDNPLRTFVEIGGGCVDTLIPLAEAGGWGGVIVEPHPMLAAALRTAVEGLPVQIVEKAISDHTGRAQMRVPTQPPVDPDERWQLGLGHLDVGRREATRCLLDDEALRRRLRVESIEVDCTTLDDLFAELELPSVDFLRIDAEGSELAILRPYTWSLRPAWLKAEHCNLLGDTLAELLTARGFHVWREYQDLYAVDARTIV